MGYLLKEALKTLCGVNQWSYAVFWKIGCQNPKLLIWEECYYEPIPYSNLPKISGVVSPELGFDNYDAWVSAGAGISQHPVPAGNKIHLLVNKMMMENHVNVIGEGLVGRAAFTGNHQWILSERFTGEANPQEVLKEVCQQFSAGIQTVSVIPVLPHGVVQLGSCFPIVENLAFVADVKSLVMQLGCVPGVLLSDSYTTEESVLKIGLPVYHENSISMNTNSSTQFTESSNYLINPNQVAGFVNQTSCSSSEPIHDTMKSREASKRAEDLGKGNHEYCQAKLISPTQPSLRPTGQLINGMSKAEMIHSNPDVWLKQASFNHPSSTFEQHSSISSIPASSESWRQLEQRILSDAGFQHHSDPHLIRYAGSVMTPLHTDTCVVSSSFGKSVTNPLDEVGEQLKDANSNLKTTADQESSQAADRSIKKNISSTNPSENGFQNASSSSTERPAPCMMNNLAKHLLSDHHSTDYTIVKGELMKEGAEYDLFRAISIPPTRQDDKLSNLCDIPDFSPHDGKLVSLGTPFRNSQYEDKCTQPLSGDDLFDILGVDFKNKLLNGSWGNSASNESESSVQNLNKIKSTPWLGKDAASDYYSVSQEKSESGIFSSAGSDHLLDAVVSRIHPSNKQSLDDNVSCKTTLTDISSSVPATSRSYGCIGSSDQMHGENFGLDKTMLKAGSLGSCSFGSGSSKDNGRTYSQSSSIYGSQISSWVEQSHETKQSSSASTAYSKKVDETSKTNRKRLKPGENPRPRPKDRQMIQDRVKELREIVPNGAKCSIDALLERTIKHMLFLQSVTKHADKLKQTGQSKILSKAGGLLLKDNFEGGATWAYEVGSQSMVCPIIVEDLNQPRQMLVEMLCEERGLFLEIADIIRGLGLTILKGVMETRNGKIWARFAVEANRDVTRMEIFISLVRLLEQTAKSSVPPSSGIDSDAMMVH